MKKICCSIKMKTIFLLVICILMGATLIGCETGKNTKVAEPVNKPIETVRPLNKSYQEIVVFEPEISSALKKDYGQEIFTCQGTLITELQMKKKYLKVEPGFDDKQYNRNSCLLVKIKINDMRIASFGARFWGGVFAGNSYMYMHMKLIDAATKKVAREEYFNSNNNPWAATWNFGSTDRSLPSDMGKIMAEYIATVAPGTGRISETEKIIKTETAGESSQLQNKMEKASFYNVAIFPWIDGGGNQIDDMNGIILDNILETVEGEKHFNLNLSFYETGHSKYDQNKRLHTLSKNDIWIQQQPDINTICKYGRELNIDTVILGSYNIASTTRVSDMEFYLVDIQKSKIFYVKSTPAETFSSYHGDLQYESFLLLKNIFKKYKNEINIK